MHAKTLWYVICCVVQRFMIGQLLYHVVIVDSEDSMVYFSCVFQKWSGNFVGIKLWKLPTLVTNVKSHWDITTAYGKYECGFTIAPDVQQSTRMDIIGTSTSRYDVPKGEIREFHPHSPVSLQASATGMLPWLSDPVTTADDVSTLHLSHSSLTRLPSDGDQLGIIFFSGEFLQRVTLSLGKTPGQQDSRFLQRIVTIPM